MIICLLPEGFEVVTPAAAIAVEEAVDPVIS